MGGKYKVCSYLREIVRRKSESKLLMELELKIFKRVSFHLLDQLIDPVIQTSQKSGMVVQRVHRQVSRKDTRPAQETRKGQVKPKFATKPQ